MNNFYIYAHYKPDGNIFYVGKGHGKRAWITRGRSTFWVNTIKKHNGYQVVLLYENLSESEAFLLEKKEIEFWGRRKDGGFLINLTDGGEGCSGRVFSSEEKEKLKERMKKLAQNPEWKAKNKEQLQKLAQTPEWKAKNKEWLQKLRQNPEYKAKNKERLQKLTQTPEWKVNQKERMKKLAQNPEWKAKNKEQLQKLAQTPEWKAKHKAAAKCQEKDYIFISPDNNVHHIHGLNEFCRLHGLHEGNMSRVHAGTRKIHKGWTKYIPLDNNHLLN
jgi:hypothetical protein